MNFDLSDEQKMLGEQARNLLTERSTPDRLRELIDAGAEWDESLWREIAELGFLGAAIPEEHGGLGMTQLDLGVISEEMGRANVALPFFSSIVLAADAIALAGSEAQKAAWLPRLASGEAIGTFAYAEGAAGWDDHAVQARWQDGRISGVKTPVADGGIATVAVVLVKKDGKRALALVDLGGAGVGRTRLASFDQLRAHYSLSFDGAAAELLDAAPAETVIAKLFDRAAVQAAFEAVGGTDACLVMARDYAMERQIFGRQLASYQAIKHRLADIAVLLELARSNAYFGAWAAGESDDDLPAAAASARLTANGAFEKGARENLQVHGGIGYTWEANCHFYYRRERTLAASLGGRDLWADRLIAHLPGTQVQAA
ncbi:acyl-CoA dehydrogenase family protein [Sphingobium sp. Sx8-8]|uniref:acyl-CoA dehydrogenase family protein n=1 Tax=Sphingobium sp. Sx8-8 TaxID=2933617 RepID=UPI001F58EC1A|nr:acyl-CoA dehydrogenase family protein [Sphingobium sp. Sx8-8]